MKSSPVRLIRTHAARFSSTLFLALSVAVMFVLGWQFGAPHARRLLAYLVSGLYALNPVVLLNGRVTEPSFRRYKWIGPVVKRMLERISVVCAQDQIYAKRFVDLGARPQRVRARKNQSTKIAASASAKVASRVNGKATPASWKPKPE